MPLYEFRCEDCGAEFENVKSMSADLSEISCPECNGIRVFKKLSLPTIIYHGRGFFVTDNKKGNK